ASAGDAVDLIEEDDRCLAAACLLEEAAQGLLALAHPLVHDRGAGHLVERCVALVRDQARELRLSGPGRSAEQDPLYRARFDLFELRAPPQGRLDEFACAVDDLGVSAEALEPGAVGVGGLLEAGDWILA